MFYCLMLRTLETIEDCSLLYGHMILAPCTYLNNQKTIPIFIIGYCKFGNVHEDFTFAKLRICEVSRI